MHLISIVINLIHTINHKANYDGISSEKLQFMMNKNMTKWNGKKLEEIAQNGQNFANEYLLNDNNIVCFMIHMIQIYNYYFFDNNSMKINDKEQSKYMKLLTINTDPIS